MIIDVYFVIQNKSLGLDLSGPAEVLRIANRVLRQQAKPERFCLHFIGTSTEATLSTGLKVADLKPLPVLDNMNRPAWVILLGQEGDDPITPYSRGNAQLISWLKRLPTNQPLLEFISICAGSTYLAYAGLLKNRRATSHHLDLEELATAEPLCNIQQDCVFVVDGNISSSAGVSTGIDLMVHKVSQYCDELTAANVAQLLVLPQRRGGNETQFSPLLINRQHLHAALHRVQQAISDTPQTDWNLQNLADIAHTSPRHLTRLFERNTGISPMAYVKQIRLFVAKSALQTGHSVTRAAHMAGFNSDTQLRRAWHASRLPDTPSIYSKKYHNEQE